MWGNRLQDVNGLDSSVHFLEFRDTPAGHLIASRPKISTPKAGKPLATFPDDSTGKAEDIEVND
jgi:hypothetical protein